MESTSEETALDIALSIAQFLANSHRHQNAVDLYEEILIISKLEDFQAIFFFEDVQLFIHQKLTSAYYCLGNANEAVKHAQQVVKMSIQNGNRTQEATALGCLGFLYEDLKKYDNSIAAYQRSLRILEELDDKEAQVIVLNNLSSVYDGLRQYDKSLMSLLRALEVLKVLGDRADKEDERKTYANLGKVYHSLWQHDDSIYYQTKALETSQAIGNQSGEAFDAINLGNLYFVLGKYEQGVKYLERSLAINKAAGNKHGEVNSSYNLASLYTILGRYDKAMSLSERSLDISVQLKHKLGEARSYLGLGDLYRGTGTWKKSVTFLKSALEIMKEIEDKNGEQIAHESLGGVYCSLGDYDNSLENFEKALELSVALGDKKGKASVCSNLGAMYLDFGQLDDSAKYQERALQLLRDIGAGEFKSSVLCKLGAASFVCKQNPSEAVEYLSESISCSERESERLDDQTKLSLREQRIGRYHVLYVILIHMGRFTDALYAAERGRARCLVDLMAETYSIENTSPPKRNVVEFNDVKRLSSNKQVNIVFMATSLTTVFFWVIKQGAEIAFVESICEQCSEDVETTLEEMVTKSHRSICENNETKCEDRSLKALHGDVQNEEMDLRNVELTEDEEQEEMKNTSSILHLMYKMLIAPVEHHIKGQEIVIVPEGSMFRVPFAALVDANGKFLSESLRIRLAPSLTTLTMIQERQHDLHMDQAGGALIVGDPDLPRIMQLSPLPGARIEAMEIAQVLGVTALVGKQATKHAVLQKIREVALVHIAAHGSSERGEIALSPDVSSFQVPQMEDCMLTLADIAKVGIRAKLVVLSCCHSGRGEIMKAEGVVGIARAFLASGARSVLVSLWLLDDSSTKEFMIRFYGHLVRDKLSASEALDQSMKWMRETEEYGVSDWAPFVLIGDDVTFDLNLRNELV